MISKPYGHMSSEESLGIDASDTCPPSSFSRDLETVEVFWTNAAAE
jgi:hypothetical protein